RIGILERPIHRLTANTTHPLIPLENQRIRERLTLTVRHPRTPNMVVMLRTVRVPLAVVVTLVVRAVPVSVRQMLPSALKMTLALLAGLACQVTPQRLRCDLPACRLHAVCGNLVHVATTVGAAPVGAVCLR